MSGLVTFFRRFMGPAEGKTTTTNTNNKNNANAETDDESSHNDTTNATTPQKERTTTAKEDCNYFTSLEDTVVRFNHNDNNTTQNGQELQQEQEQENENGQEEELDTTSMTAEVNEEFPEVTEEVLDHRTWRKKNNKLLKAFLKRRLFKRDEDDSSSSDSCRDCSSTMSGSISSKQDDGDEEDNPETQNSNLLETQEKGPETQEVDDHDHYSEEAALFAARKQRLAHIPHIHDTVHDITRLDDIDQYTKTCTMELASVTKLFSLRNLKRFAKEHAYKPRCQTILRAVASRQSYKNHNGKACGGGGLARILTAPIQCDGPLATVYAKTVLHLEISQLYIPASASSAAAAAGINNNLSNVLRHNQSRSKQDMVLFFYDQYADYIFQILDDNQYDPRKHVLVVALEKVPAICFIPYVYPFWFERQRLSDFCVCIGGSTTLLATDGERTKYHPRFDSDDLVIRVGLGDKRTGKMKEWSVSKAILKAAVVVEVEGEEDDVGSSKSDILKDEVEVLRPRFDKWQEVWQTRILTQPHDNNQQQQHQEVNQAQPTQPDIKYIRMVRFHCCSSYMVAPSIDL